MKKRFALLVTFVQEHKVAIAVGVTALVFVTLMMRNQKQLNAFLEEHGLLDMYYAIEE